MKPRLAAALRLCAVLPLVAAIAACSNPKSVRNSDEMDGAYAAWRKGILNVPAPKPGCYKAAYPSRTWKAVPCQRASEKLQNIGNGNDIIAKASAGLIATAAGEFRNITGLASVYTSPNPSNTPPGDIGTYSFQINSNSSFTVLNPKLILPDKSTPCNTTDNPCRGFQQFVWDQPGPGYNGTAYIEYWLMGFWAKHNVCPINLVDPATPSSSARYFFRAGNDCVANSNSAMILGGIDVTQIGKALFAGLETSTQDEVVIAYNNVAYMHSLSNVLRLDKGWREAEFNIFGDGSGFFADFNPGTTMTVINGIFGPNNSTITATCPAGGMTSEQNNLSLPPCKCFVNNGVVTFTQSNAANPVCACPSGQTWNAGAQACQ